MIVLFMGRITVSFRQSFMELISTLIRNYKKNLKDQARQRAFDSLIESSSRELGAMSYARIPYVLDCFKLTGVIDNRKAIERIREEAEEIEKSIANVRS